MANALHVARQRGFLAAGGCVVMVQSDNIRVLNMIRHHVPDAVEQAHRESVRTCNIRETKLSPIEKSALAAIKQLQADTGVILVVRHVRGHQQGRGRNWVNRIRDQTARRHMRARRRKSYETARLISEGDAPGRFVPGIADAQPIRPPSPRRT